MKYVVLAIATLFTFTCFCQSSFDESEALFDKCLTDSTKAKVQLEYQRTHAHSHKEKIRYDLNQAIYYSYYNQFKLSEAALAKAEQKLQQKNDVELTGELVRIRSIIYFKTNRFDASNKLINGFLNDHPKISDKLLVNLHMNLNSNDIAQGKYEQAKQNALIGYNIFLKRPESLSDNVKVKVLTGLYNAYHYQAQYDSALYYLYKQEPYIKDGTVAKGGFYDRIGLIYTNVGKYDKAIAYHQKSIDILEKMHSPILLSHSLYNLGIANKATDVNKAIPIFERALKTAREVNYEQITGYALQELGDIYLTRKEYSRADKYNREALEILQNAGIEHGVIHVLLNLGRQDYETGNYKEALNYLEEALDMAKSNEDIVSQEYCYEYLYSTYERMGDYRNAYHYHQLFAQKQREILKLDLQSNIEELNLSYDIRMEKMTNKLLKKEVKLKNKKIRAEQEVKWLLGILLLMLLIAGWFLRRLFVQRAHLKEVELKLVQSELKGLEQEKERTIKELDTVKEQLINKNFMIGELNNLLRENEQTLISKEQFGSLVSTDTDWIQFLAKLQLLYPDFADNLKRKHPNLSNNEFRLSALVRLNLSDKEISELLIIEVSSVKKAKSRLKQKLELDSNDKLDVYLGQM